MVPTYSIAGDVDEYVRDSKQEVNNTKKKLQSTSGIFGQPNFRGTVIRPALPSDRSAIDQPQADQSEKSSEEENSGE